MGSKRYSLQNRWFCGLAFASVGCCSAAHAVGPVLPIDRPGNASVFVKLQASPGGQNETVDMLLRIGDEDSAITELFRRGTHVVPELARSLRTRELRARAGRALAYVGDPGGLKTLLSAIRTEPDRALRIELSAYLAGSMVQSKDRESIAFLKECMQMYRDTDADGPAVAAALTLGSMRTTEALGILRMARHLDEEELAEHEIAKAQRWITSARSVVGYPTPGRQAGDDERVKELVLANAFYAEGEEAGLGVDAVIWNMRRDKALVEVMIKQDPTSPRGYQVIVERVPGRVGEFRISGIWLNLVA